MLIPLLRAAGRSARWRALDRLGAGDAVASAGRVALVTLAVVSAAAWRSSRWPSRPRSRSVRTARASLGHRCR